ncbi:hypothetical protein [Halococcus sp. PRR34]|uniref:hypothetical protein n=1 Tax=Halococcus sp. PRR34 TaxID=3020830 RepID=UPI0023601DB3|nr:hypothetical protein [Halococcus sp. PRR34]
MSDGEPARRRESTSVGVVAPETDATAIVDAVDTAGGGVHDATETVSTETADIDPDAIVAVGDGGLRECVATDIGVPVLPIDVDRVPSLASGDDPDGIERFLAGEYPIRERPVVAVDTPTTNGRALRDVALVTAAPASISEFAVAAGTEVRGHDAENDGNRTPFTRFRADGVVVATPVGSHGYARAAGGPVVVDGTDVGAVVPISPFATDPDHWVVPLAGVSLTVERDDADVELFVDGCSLGRVRSGSPVRITLDGTLRLASPHRV